MTKVKETPGIMMKTVIEIHPSVMDYKAFPKALGLKDPQREPLYPKTRHRKPSQKWLKVTKGQEQQRRN